MGRSVTCSKTSDSAESDSSSLAALHFLLRLACLACSGLSAASNKPSAFLLPALRASALASLRKERLENAFAAGLASPLASAAACARLALAFNCQQSAVT